jgi:adenine-specific DNA-methyltransferase
MGRTWTLIERGEQAHTIALPRIRRVVEGTDRSGITEEVGWTGGGGCAIFEVAEKPA